MDCKKVSRLIDSYAAGELFGDRAEEVKAHLDDCAGCRKVLDEYRLAARALQASMPSVPEADAQFFRQLDRRLDQVDRANGRKAQPIIRWRFAAGVAAAAAAVFIVSVQFIPGTPITTDRAPIASSQGNRESGTVALREEPTVMPAFRWQPSQYTPVSMNAGQRPPMTQYSSGEAAGLPRFNFPRQGLPIEGTTSLQAQSINRVNYERLQNRLHDLELRMDALEHKAQ